eukprot:3642741-Lingulodinium_polyedra.AAC.1
MVLPEPRHPPHQPCARDVVYVVVDRIVPICCGYPGASRSSSTVSHWAEHPDGILDALEIIHMT